MDSSESTYTVEQVMNFTLQDLPEHLVISIEGWCDLPPAKREECLRRIRELTRQREETVQSAPVDPTTLEEKLKQLASAPARLSYSPTSSCRTLPPDLEAELQRDIRIEIESYHALLDDGGIPSHPLDVSFAILEDPGDYAPIISYWFEADCNLGRRFFHIQLIEWRAFRDYQRSIREHYLPHARFRRYQEKVRDLRGEHGHDDGIELLEDSNKQSKKQNWVEYQYKQYAHLRGWQRCVEDAEAGIISARRALEDEGLLDPDSYNGDHHLAMALQQDTNAEREAVRHVMFTERGLALATRRLEAAESERFGEDIERTFWIGLAWEHLESARARLQEETEGRFTEFDLSAEDDVKLTEKAFEADRSTFVGNTVRRTALLTTLKDELQSAERQLREAEELQRTTDLKGELVKFLLECLRSKGKLKLHKKLVDWVDQQYQELMRASTISDQDIYQPDHQDQLETLRYSKPQRPSSQEIATPHKSLTSQRPETDTTDASSILSTSGISKVPKSCRKELQRKPAVSPTILQDATMATSSTQNEQLSPLTTSNKVSSPTSRTPPNALLHRVSSCRVSKAQGGIGSQVSLAATHEDDSRRSSRKNNRKNKPTSAQGSEDLVQSKREKRRPANAPIRRSLRLLGKKKICYPK